MKTNLSLSAYVVQLEWMEMERNRAEQGSGSVVEEGFIYRSHAIPAPGIFPSFSSVSFRKSQSLDNLGLLGLTVGDFLH